MRIGVFGNCQATVMSQWLTRMLPADEIILYSLMTVKADDYQMVADHLSACDAVISQVCDDAYGPLATEALRGSSKNLIVAPNFSFTGFHPDCAYLHHHDGAVAGSPLGVYHSRLILAGFLNDLGPVRIGRLFNAHTYHLFGYFDEFIKAEANFDDMSAAFGFSLRVRELMRRAGPFMHTINHASPGLTRYSSYEAANLAGASPNIDVEAIEDDMAEDTIWPLYPQLAERLGLASGDLIFTRPTHQSIDRPREVRLDRLISESLAHYDHWRDTLDFSPFQQEAQILGESLKRTYS